MDTSHISQSDKIVKCPKCSEIFKAYGENYFNHCGHRWEISRYKLKETRTELEKHDSYEPKQNNSGQIKSDGRPGDRSKPDGEVGQSDDGNNGKPEKEKEKGDSLNFV